MIGNVKSGRVETERLGDQRVSVIRPSNDVELLPSSGLNDGECKAIHDEAYRLMVDGRSLGVGAEVHDGGKNIVFVLDVHGNRYTIMRDAGTYLLFDPALGIIAANTQLDAIVEDLRTSL